MGDSVHRVLRSSLLVGSCAFLAFQAAAQQPWLEGIATGKTRVIDLSYPISDKMVAWPGDARAFEAKINATVEKNG